MNAKPLFVLIMFVAMIALFANGMMSGVDLTPGTPYVPPGSGSNPAPGLMVQGAGGVCGYSYTVRQGDTLSQIARTCGVTIEVLLSANASITNPNLIHPGQELTIIYPIELPTAAPTIPPAVPVLPTTPPTVAPANPTVAPTAAPAQPESSGAFKRPGEKVVVEVKDFTPLSFVRVEMGKEGGPLDPVQGPQIRADGTLRVEVPLPPNAAPGEKWVVVVTSTADPSKVVRSDVYTIVP